MRPSLALAKHAGDTTFGAYVMSNMAAQLVYLGDGAKAAQMARAACTPVSKLDSATSNAPATPPGQRYSPPPTCDRDDFATASTSTPPA